MNHDIEINHPVHGRQSRTVAGILLKELQLTRPGTYDDGSRIESSGRGYFPGTANGIDISVKDNKRFKDTSGWGFFNFGHHAPPYAETAAV